MKVSHTLGRRRFVKAAAGLMAAPSVAGNTSARHTTAPAHKPESVEGGTPSSGSIGDAATGHPLAYPRLGPPWPEPKRPSWISKGIVCVGSWEPLPWIYRKNWQTYSTATALSGSVAESVFRRERSEATAIALKAAGVNLVISSFQKGFGVANEKETMQEAAEWGQLLHKHGLKMAVYVSALLLYEDLYGEFPEAKDWHRVLYDGTPDVYANDGYRYRAFLNHPGYVTFMKRVCELAVKAGADMIVFDTVNQTRENHHPLSARMFRDWLKAKYPTDDRWFFRTGLHNREWIKIPHYPDITAPATFDQSIMQEYIHFKTESYTNYAAEMKTFVQSLNAECAVFFNSGGSGIVGRNIMVRHNADLARLLKWLDAFSTESRDVSEYTADGGLISKIRTIKVAQLANSVHTCNNWTDMPRGPVLEMPRDDPRLRFAESMAFNRFWLGLMGFPADMERMPESGRRYIRFFWNNRELLGEGPTATDVAVLRTFASMAFSNYATHRETMLAEQALIQGQMPFDIISDQNLDDLSKYKALILADQECLSDAQVDTLRQYVRDGGGLIATANTSMFDHWRRQRARFGLHDVLGFDLPSRAGGKAVIQRRFGAGRAAYIQELIPRIPVPPRRSFDLSYWAPPTNAAQLLAAVRWVGGSLRWHITAPPFVVPEVYHQAQPDRYVLHLINYNCWRQPTVNNINIRLRTENAGKFRRVTTVSPDEDTPVASKVRPSADGLTFVVPNLAIYSITTIEK